MICIFCIWRNFFYHGLEMVINESQNWRMTLLPIVQKLVSWELLYAIHVKRTNQTDLKYSQIVYHNPCFNLFILHNDSFDNLVSEMIKNDFFYISTYCLLRKLFSYYTFNKFTTCYKSSCLRLCTQLT